MSQNPPWSPQGGNPQPGYPPPGQQPQGGYQPQSYLGPFRVNHRKVSRRRVAIHIRDRAGRAATSLRRRDRTGRLRAVNRRGAAPE